MTDSAAANEDPAIVGVPPETPEQIRPSATGVVVGPFEGESDVGVSDGRDKHAPPEADNGNDVSNARDQLLEDAEGGTEGSLPNGPDDGDVAPI